ncbi:MAG: hypothetical protein ACE5O2_02390 [Armatimonadota bacterium]
MDTDIEKAAEDIESRRNVTKSVLCLSLLFWPGVFLYVLVGALRWRRLTEEQRRWVNRYAYGLAAVFAAAGVLVVLVFMGSPPAAIGVSVAMLGAFAIYALFF